MKSEFSYEEVLNLPLSNDKLKGFEFIVEDLLRDILKRKSPKSDNLAYYDRMNFLKEYNRRIAVGESAI